MAFLLRHEAFDEGLRARVDELRLLEGPAAQDRSAGQRRIASEARPLLALRRVRRGRSAQALRMLKGPPACFREAWSWGWPRRASTLTSSPRWMASSRWIWEGHPYAACGYAASALSSPLASPEEVQQPDPEHRLQSGPPGPVPRVLLHRHCTFRGRRANGSSSGGRFPGPGRRRADGRRDPRTRSSPGLQRSLPCQWSFRRSRVTRSISSVETARSSFGL
jgi:hypothetical protein